MTRSIDLRRLADATPAAPPFDFAQFGNRCAATAAGRRTTLWSIAGSTGMLGVVGLLALMTQAPESMVRVMEPAPTTTGAPLLDAPYSPALVDLGRFDVTSELEDHIALLDAQISAARVYAAPPEQLRQLESARAQINASLQRVSYAQSVLSF